MSPKRNLVVTSVTFCAGMQAPFREQIHSLEVILYSPGMRRVCDSYGNYARPNYSRRR